MVEFLEDEIERDPSARFSPEALKDGTVVRLTGDPVVDQWERDLAEGKDPDFALGLAPATLERLKKMAPDSFKKTEPVPEPEPIELEEFTDSYGDD